jgi:hypothetical protein
LYQVTEVFIGARVMVAA